MSKAEYNCKFKIGLSSGEGPQPMDVTKAAHSVALDIRKFEIEMYWKRGTYFWALIASAFVAFFAILNAERIPDKEIYAFCMGMIGFLFSWAWFLGNRGSKYWLENWENHVDLLEDGITGPLYKTVLSRAGRQPFWERSVTGPLPISVAKLNQWVSASIVLLWMVLCFQVLPTSYQDLSKPFLLILVTAVSAFFAAMMRYQGASHRESRTYEENQRDVDIA